MSDVMSKAEGNGCPCEEDISLDRLKTRLEKEKEALQQLRREAENIESIAIERPKECQSEGEGTTPARPILKELHTIMYDIEAITSSMGTTLSRTYNKLRAPETKACRG